MNNEDIRIRLEKQENIFARCAVMIQKDLEMINNEAEALQVEVKELKERIEALEKKESVDNG